MAEQDLTESHDNYNRWLITLSVIGGIFITCSFICELWFKQYTFINQLSSIIGLTGPIIIIAVKNLSKGKVHMHELILLTILATSITGKVKTAGIIALFLLLTIIFEKKTKQNKRQAISSTD